MSPDFKRHSVAYLVEPLLAAHDRRRFKVFCYSNVSSPDAVTRRIQSLSEEWRDISGLSDEWAADRMRADRIDILVDLAGHTAGGRLLLFARKPAPVQVTWLGYPDTTGVQAIDYRLTDGIADPEGRSDRFHSEKLVRLGNGFLCYGPPPEAPAVGELPMLKTGHVTFGCFNNLSKLSPAVVAVWAELLRAAPGSRLIVKAFGLRANSARRTVGGLFSGHGIAPERIELCEPEDSVARHLGKYGEVDIALDVFPYNGTVTTCEALWMGVPVVTLAGASHVARVGASVLSHAGLPELVATSAEEYVRKTLELAGDVDRLRALRATMRQRLGASPLLDAQGFARTLETAYGEMRERWIRSEEEAEAASPPRAYKVVQA